MRDSFGGHAFFILEDGCMIFCGGLFVVLGILSALDAVCWRINAGEDIVNYAISYAQSRYNHYTAELSLCAFIVALGLILILAAARSFKRCSHCGNYVHKKQSFCHSCGDKIS